MGLIGCIFPKWGSELWQPLQGMSLKPDVLHVIDTGQFFQEAEALVRRNPADIVHLSKPRLPNIVIGLLYKYLWNAKVISDIDDEELGFVGADEPLTGPLADNERPADFTGKLATQFSVGLASCFDGITVSNPALQAVYGGEVIPHARDERSYAPSLERRIMNRELFGIPLDRKVVLFSGTPRKHKGIMDIAHSLAELGRRDVLFVVVGDFPFSDVKDELKAIKGVNIKFIPGQPYSNTPDVVSVADCVVLVQDVTSRSAQFQAPAKLTDALAMGVQVLAQATPALKNLHEAGAFIDVKPENLTKKLATALADTMEADQSESRELFLKLLSSSAVSANLKAYVDQLDNKSVAVENTDWNQSFESFRSSILDLESGGTGRLSGAFVDFLQQSASSLSYR
ncbi:glycosyltransferase [Marinimicrobium sp. ABcell2]|uniref:glycosyltransferase n=1 Tax=Marinimicrobium sp. ABcell2 TaxID=3069751 RepID=UPI0027B473CC|nr:glycosyltransferase [Marinimicrobium sp. ABcell2]MDQ2078324.1 glycosyltransferase [Marinimicrobium sp. ABcell2]